MAEAKARIFIGILDVAGYCAGLEAGFRTLGHTVFNLNMGENTKWFVPSGNSHPIPNLYRYTMAKFNGTRGLSAYNPVRYFWTASQLASLAVVLAWICLRFDIIILKSGIGFTSSQLDLRIFRTLGKKLVFIFLGSDSRPPYLLGFWGTDAMSAERLVDWTRTIRSAVDTVSPYADVIFDNPLSAHFQTRTCHTIQVLGCMIDLRKLPEVGAVSRTERVVRILHAPSHADVKGTDAVRASIQRLRNLGCRIDYIELTDRPNHEVIAEIAQCDIVIDDLHCDSQGGMLALEAASLSKAVIVAGEGKYALEQALPPEARLPLIYASTGEFDAVLHRLVTDEPWRTEVGRSSGDFVRRWAQPHQVASRLLQAAEGTAPDSWRFDPFGIRYCAGAGGALADVRQAIRKVLGAGGVEALCLAEKPALAVYLSEFARQGDRETGAAVLQQESA